ncbi:Protein mlo2 [Taphrina deformans PYCC 5710]|uniref:Protein mlo2 n=1 Tax=Taphrina deformans (strain PYCC 5710 / ATCC 11124 / CBS 356.35 / IMI 108563 / JCM 9778 / NBRC 8474) TaxID=1097556 RepID=R4XJM7_TAPDE|nr:Protein mlo2 [Taphrina deformans PYCC 5710]|eukprot:CCG83555.1 Protein mlo2 [Taphrina deformans PYCC 5710]
MEPPSTLKEYVESQDRLDREARDMFPYDFSSCSFNQGYVKQQVFACKTCSPTGETDQRGGVCYSCSITCHGEHDLIELFNRRAFRCDCGTPAMGGKECCITHETRPVNAQNTYNDNYENVFCYCKKEYDADKEDGTMYQCLLCEDWFHDRCIRESEELSDDELFEHYLCHNCVHKESWLRRYTAVEGFCVSPKDGLARTEPSGESSGEAIAKRKFTAEFDNDRDENEHKRRNTETRTDPVKVEEMAGTECSLFLLDSFRTQFCACAGCTHRIAGLPALATEEEVYDPPIDDQDDNESSFEAGSRALEQTLQAMPRDKAIEGLLAFNKLKDHITTCLKPLADSGEIITSEHVRNFFESRPK